MLWNLAAGLLAALSFSLTLWQWIVARRFPLHQRVEKGQQTPAVTLLKPLKGCDSKTESCLRSWFEQEYTGPVQILFGVASPHDPVCGLVQRLLKEYSEADAELVLCEKELGPNAKVSTLVQLQERARHEVVVMSDADVRVAPDLLQQLVVPLAQKEMGLVNCFYKLGDTCTPAMRWEATAVNADFWSQVLQSQSLKPIDFALGAVMATTRSRLREIGAFTSLLEYLADDYQLGNQLARRNARIALCPVVVECRSEPQTWKAVWIHQLRWARTIRVCQPTPFFFSILSNGSLWPTLWMATDRSPLAFGVGAIFLLARVATALSNQRRLTQESLHWTASAFVLIKDAISVAIWLLAFAGNKIEWRGRKFRMLRDGRLQEIGKPSAEAAARG